MIKHTLKSQKHFRLAVDHDLLKFRAPQIFNLIINNVSTQYQATVVPGLARLQARHGSGIVGQESMLEHLHPNLQGYFELSNSFYIAIEKAAFTDSWQHVPPTKAWQQRLILPSEEYNGYALVQQLTSDYPFTESRTTPTLPKPSSYPLTLGLQFYNKSISWQSMMEKNLAYYQQQGNTLMTSKTLQILADALPHDALYNVKAAELLQAQGNTVLAQYYFSRAKRAGWVVSAAG